MDGIWTSITLGEVGVLPVGKSESIDALAALVRRAADGLSADAVATLADNPEAVVAALAATASTLGNRKNDEGRLQRLGGRSAELVDDSVVRQRLDRRTRPDEADDLLTSDEIAKRIGLRSRQSVHQWARRGRLLGWKAAKRGFLFPAGQLDRSGRPLDGIAQIADVFANAYDAWSWMTTPLASLGGATPLSVIRRGDIDTAVQAARSEAQGDFA